MPRYNRGYYRPAPRRDTWRPTPAPRPDYDGPAMASKHFNSSTEFHTWVMPDIDKLPYTAYFGDNRREAVEGAQLLVNGDNTYVARARQLLDNFQERIESIHYKWEHQISGAFPDVPAYCAGQPDSMWYREQTTSDQTPLRVWVNISSSWDVTEDQLRSRGVALAAFAIALSEKRPVYITPWIQRGELTTYGSVISWDLHTSPLVLSELLPCLSDVDITRHLSLPACSKLNPMLTNHSAPWHPDDGNEQKMRKHLGCADADIYLPGIKSYDPMLNDPIAWLKTNIAKHGQEETE